MLMTMSHKSLNLLFEVPGSFWCKQRNLYVIFIRKKEKAIVTHFCSQFSFFFKSPQTGTTSGRYWVGRSKGINQLYFISCPTSHDCKTFSQSSRTNTLPFKDRSFNCTAIDPVMKIQPFKRNEH